MAPLLITFAVKVEARPFHKLVGERAELRILITGIGRRNAETAIRNALAEQSPGLVLTCGFAGGLDPELAAGTVIFSADEDPGSRRGNEAEVPPSSPMPPPDDAGYGPAATLSGLDSGLLAAGARPARFHCANRVAASAESKRALRLSTGADAVEMESGIIRAICRKNEILSATVRVISDTANEDLPLDFNRLMDSDQNLKYGKLTAALLKSPGKIGALLRLQKQTRAAAERLARVLAAFISSRTQAPL
jgi:adenosylhomocysteine nucleosidase